MWTPVVSSTPPPSSPSTTPLGMCLTYITPSHSMYASFGLSLHFSSPSSSLPSLLFLSSPPRHPASFTRQWSPLQARDRPTAQSVADLQCIMAEDGAAAKHVAPTAAHGHVEGEANVLGCLHPMTMTHRCLILRNTQASFRRHVRCGRYYKVMSRSWC